MKHRIAVTAEALREQPRRQAVTGLIGGVHVRCQLQAFAKAYAILFV
jgi:hypothetical protein